jgi:aryl-alcohol dehydrogenase-like predicted oxidoreductase
MPEGEQEQKIELGKTGIMIPPMGTGAWAWGDRIFWGYGRGYSAEDVKGAFDESLAAGINFFDTAEVYGRGVSERLLGKFIKEELQAGEPELVVATKFLPFPWRLWKGTLISALKRSLQRLELTKVDLYQIHIPLPPFPVEVWAGELAEAVRQGLTVAVGVSNYSISQMRRTYKVLSKSGVPLASNQVEYSLLNRTVEKNGLLATCQELGVTLIAYSPIAKGILSGKYTPGNPPPGGRSRQYNPRYLERIQPLIRMIREIGDAHAGKTPSQVALNWTICKGTVPIPGAKNSRQMVENAGALGWRLTPQEVEKLDEVSKQVS